jgi:hypothetical protein
MLENNIIIEGQTFLDIVIQSRGSIEAMFDVAVDNGVSITEVLFPGQKIKTTLAPFNRNIYNYYKAHGIYPATKVDANLRLQLLFENGLFENGLFR